MCETVGGTGSLGPNLYVFPWVFTLFSQGVRYGAIWRIWDRLFTGWTPAGAGADTLSRTLELGSLVLGVAVVVVVLLLLLLGLLFG
mgnify:CR=1 FL=1